MTPDRRDHYRLLHVQADAPTEVIRGAYRALIAVHHPDVGGDHATALRLNDAFAVLSDTDRRARYDAARTTPCDRRSVLRGASADWARLYVDGDLAPIDVRLRDRSRGGFCVYSGRALAPARRVRLVGRAFDVAGAVVNCLRFDRVYTVHVRRTTPPDAPAAPRSRRTTA